MKTIKLTRFFLATMMLLFVTLPLAAQDVNNSVAAFMRMGIGARIIAMGEAGSTVSQDIVSGYWNPAGLAKMKDFEVGTMYNLSMDNDRSHKYASIGTRLSFGAVAFSWVNAGVSDIDGFDDSGEPTGSFSDEEHSFALSYGNSIGRFSFGFSPKLYVSTIDDESETGYGLDAGIKLDINQYLEAGVMARDIYSDYTNAEVPYEISAGLALFPFVGVTIAADAKIEQDQDPYFCFGAEYWTSIGRDPEADSKLSVVNVSEAGSWEDVLSYTQTGLRLGFNQGRLSAGTGIRFRSFQLDYVFRLNNHDIFSDDHILSLILRF